MEGSPFLKNDVRLRSIPFETRRPSQEEMQRTWMRLSEFLFLNSFVYYLLLIDDEIFERFGR